MEGYYVCNREECFAFDKFRENNCRCLTVVKDMGEDCSFHKMRTAKFNTKTIEKDVSNYAAMKVIG